MTDADFLLDWYNENKRDLPWRNTQNDYKIWLSEIILQQTRVEQGLPYYQKYIENYPNIFYLANASVEEVLKLWQGLGYYSRARNMHKTAKEVVEKYNGVFPNNYQLLLKLTGIGPYTAAAIASFAFNLPHAVLDGNVYRVLSRYFGVFEPINSTKGQKTFTMLANEFLNKKKPALHNQAIMELGALVCTPQNPTCKLCPLSTNCMALSKKIQTQLPVKIPKSKPVSRYFNYFVVIQNNKTYLQKRTQKDIWHGLFEPILIETNEPKELQEKLDLFLKMGWVQQNKIFVNKTFNTKHKLTHQTIFADFICLEIKQKNTLKEFFEEVHLSNVDKYPTHRLFEKFLQNTKLPFLK